MERRGYYVPAAAHRCGPSPRVRIPQPPVYVPCAHTSASHTGVTVHLLNIPSERESSAFSTFPNRRLTQGVWRMASHTACEPADGKKKLIVLHLTGNAEYVLSANRKLERQRTRTRHV